MPERIPDGHAAKVSDVLVVEDSNTLAVLIEHWLRSGIPEIERVERVATLRAALQHLADRRPGVIVLDLNLEDSTGITTFRNVQEFAGGSPIIILSAEEDEAVALTTVREGAQDYIVKGNHDGNPLARPVRFAMERLKRQRVEALLRVADEQLAIAQSVQEHLFPDVAPVIPGLDIAGHCVPGEGIAGDYFDYFSLSQGLGIVVGDVMGHGYDAALIMAGVRGVLRALARSHANLGALLSAANEVLTHDLSERFVTVILAAIDPSTLTMHYAAAGHGGYLLDACGGIKARLQATAPPLGVGGEAIENSAPLQLAAGDLLLLYTDGIPESFGPGGVPFGDEGVLRIVRESLRLPAKQIVDNLLRSSRMLSANSPQRDDMTVVAVKVCDAPENG